VGPAHDTVAEREARAISFVGDDASLVAALRKRHPAAVAAFHDRYASHMLKLLVRLLGNDRDLHDVHHDVFVRALGSIDSLLDPSRLTSWMVSVAVYAARTCLQRRYRGGWLKYFAPEELPELGTEQDWDAAAELRLTYGLLERLPTEERIVFTLRFIEGMGLAEVADACQVSLATAKRRLQRAEARFLALVQRHPALADRIERGSRWSRA
jgi:RNA polymerase sigma-70 factor, ECF subfamily